MNKFVVLLCTLYSLLGRTQVNKVFSNITLSFSLGMGYSTATTSGLNSLDDFSVIDPIAVTYIPKQRFHLFMPQASLSVSRKVYRGLSVGIANYFGGFNKEYQIIIPDNLDFSIPHHRQFVNEIEERTLEFNSRILFDYSFTKSLSFTAGYSFYSIINSRLKRVFLIDNTVDYFNWRRRFAFRDSRNPLFLSISYKIHPRLYLATSYDFNLAFTFVSVGVAFGAPSQKTQ